MRATLWLLGLAATQALGASPWRSLFVAPTGKDVGDCASIAAPCATPWFAQSVVRGFARPLGGDVVVYLRGGTYYAAQTWNFTMADSGSPGATISYEGYPGETVVISGGESVTGWCLWDADRNVWQAPLTFATRQLYVNGERAQRTLFNQSIPDMENITTTGYLTTNASFTQLARPDLLEFVYTASGASWTEARCSVASILPRNDGKEGSNITMVQPCFYNGRNKPDGQGFDVPATIENMFEELDAPGEFFYNSTTQGNVTAGWVFYIPRPGEDMRTATVVAPRTEQLLVVQGVWNMNSTDPIQFVSNLAFSNLVFDYATWLLPSTGEGYIDMQSGFRIVGPTIESDCGLWVPTPATVSFHTVRDVTVSRCTFQRFGMSGLTVDAGSQNVEVSQSIFRDLSGGGVQAGQVLDHAQADPTKYNADILVTDNLFYGMPMEYHSCAPLLGGYLSHSSFVHNTILDPANTGISLGWGWSRQPSYANNNNIVGNLVSGSNWLLVDGGSIYTLGPQPNSSVAYNYARSQRQLYGSLYHDEGSAFFHTHHNVVEDVPEWLHIWTSSIHNITVEFCWTNQEYMIEKGTNITLQNITYVTPLTSWPIAAQLVKQQAGLRYPDALGAFGTM